MKKSIKFLLVILLLAILAPQTTVGAAGGANETERISGENRIETSIKVSKEAYKSSADTLFLAGFSGEADALTATFLAGKKKSPLLLTYKDRIDSNLLLEIKRLNPKEIVILGGENVVFKKLENDLNALGYQTKRIQGRSRIETAVNVATDYYKYIDVPEVFIIEYNSLVDALAIGPVAAKNGVPILITLKDKVPSEVSKFLKDHKVKKATIIGGRSKVSDKGRSELLKSVGLVDRVYGDDRVKTSLKIAATYFKNPESTFVANGTQFADALIGGYFAGMKNSPIILVGRDNIQNEALKYLKDKKVKTIVLGGNSVVSGNLYKLIENRENVIVKPPITLEPPIIVKPPVVVQPPIVETGVSAIEKEVVRLVNIERAKNGLSPFVISKQLSQVARLKSEDMQVNNYFEHISPKYGNPFDMMKSYGIKYRIAGENIAMGHPNPDAVVKGWMNSPGHRDNILNKSFNTIGIGAHNYKGTIYWTQMFTD
nr:cell wall-binding repeat-containing protein [Tissierella sp.]